MFIGPLIQPRLTTPIQDGLYERMKSQRFFVLEELMAADGSFQRMRQFLSRAVSIAVSYPPGSYSRQWQPRIRLMHQVIRHAGIAGKSSTGPSIYLYALTLFCTQIPTHPTSSSPSSADQKMNLSAAFGKTIARPVSPPRVPICHRQTSSCFCVWIGPAAYEFFWDLQCAGICGW